MSHPQPNPQNDPKPLAVTQDMVQSNGLTLHVTQAGPAEGPLVILLHGFPESGATAWARQIPALAAAGYRVWAPDQRGYNLSDKPAGIEAYHLDRLSDDVAGLIDAAGVQQAAIVGHDWGASVAWWTARRHTSRVRRLAVLNAPHPVLWQQAMRSSLKQRLRSWYLLLFQIRGLPERMLRSGNWNGLIRTLTQSARPGLFDDEALEHYRAAWSQPGAITAMLNWYRASGAIAALEAGRITPPTLIIWGAQETFAERALAETSAALCDNARLVFVEEATHWVHHEEPETVSRLLLEFLR